MKIAVDGMGGDFAPYEVVQGVALALEEIPDLEIVLTGDKAALENEIASIENRSRIEIVPTEQVITMHDKPRDALLKKKQSSMHKAIELVKDDYAKGIVTAGNTGAYMAISIFTLGRLKGVTRPAIGVVLPFRDGGYGLLLDVGASVDISAKEYLVFALLGKVYLATLTGKTDISIGLLNIGEEEEKGNKITQEAYKLLKENFNDFAGNVEPQDLLNHKVDVLVTDGFTGNVLEKSYEGAAEFIIDAIKDEIKKSNIRKIAAVVLKKAIKNAFSTLNYENFGGSPLLGVDGISIKAHGRSKRVAIKNAIKVCYELAENNLIDNFRDSLEKANFAGD
ncbi:MAG: phosphate acyltransferase PlsX [Caldisericaceae bacterium]